MWEIPSTYHCAAPRDGASCGRIRSDSSTEVSLHDLEGLCPERTVRTSLSPSPLSHVRDDALSFGVVVPVLSCVLSQIVRRNDAKPSDHISAFHALKAPTITIRQYIDRITKYASCSPECLVLALIYMDRVIGAHPKLVLSSFTVHRFLIISVMVAAKFFDDAYFNNSYYARIGGISCLELNALELQFLYLINFSLTVTPDVFGKYRQELLLHAAGPHPLCQCNAEVALVWPAARAPAAPVQLFSSVPYSHSPCQHISPGLIPFGTCIAPIHSPRHADPFACQPPDPFHHAYEYQHLVTPHSQQEQVPLIHQQLPHPQPSQQLIVPPQQQYHDHHVLHHHALCASDLVMQAPGEAHCYQGHGYLYGGPPLNFFMQHMAAAMVAPSN